MPFVQSLFHRIRSFLNNYHLALTQTLVYKKKPLALPPNFDYVRFATLCLCAEEIHAHSVEGNIAEVGVYKGNFAKRLNVLFPEKTLYLFDTFQGFHERDIQTEKVRGFSRGNQDFSDTDEHSVLALMQYPEKCSIKKGYFPATAEGLDEKFCFVSVDADLYEPIYQSLVYFIPRMSKGGYMFIHDVNNDEYPGARQAVQDYCADHAVAFVPIPDSGGSIVIAL